MKQYILSLVLVLMSMVVSTPAAAKCDNMNVSNRNSRISTMMRSIPQNIVVKQTAQFNDGRTLTVYYKKTGDQCEVYTPCDLTGYDLDDAAKIKSTTFEITDHVEGRLYRKASVAEVTRVLKRMVNRYL